MTLRVWTAKFTEFRTAFSILIRLHLKKIIMLAQFRATYSSLAGFIL